MNELTNSMHTGQRVTLCDLEEIERTYHRDMRAIAVAMGEYLPLLIKRLKEMKAPVAYTLEAESIK